MARTSQKSAATTWPFMESFGMYRKKIGPDGNCMFRALSDQLYDSPDHHPELRSKVVNHMRKYREEYEPYIAGFREEGLSSSQTRTRSSRSPPTDDDDEFEAYCDEMETLATWGQQLELKAFAEAYDRDIVIHQPTSMSNPFGFMSNQRRASGSPVTYVHLAFGGEDDSPHYESVRKVDKAVTSFPLAKQDATEPEATLAQTECSSAESRDTPEPFDQLSKACPNITRSELVELVDDCKESLESKFAEIIERNRERSISRSELRRSESPKRSRDDDDEEDDASERQAKRPARGIDLENRARVLLSVSDSATSSTGTGMSFHVRLDTSQSTLAQATASEKAIASKGIATDCNRTESPAIKHNAKVEENGAESRTKDKRKGAKRRDSDKAMPKQGRRTRARTRAQGKARS